MPNKKSPSVLWNNRKILIRVAILLLIFLWWYFTVVSIIWWWYTENLWTLISNSWTLILWAVAIAFSLWILSIDIQKAEHWVVDLLNVIVLLWIVAYIYFTKEFSWTLFLQLIAIVLFHTAIFVYIRTKQTYLQTRVDTSIRGVAQIGVISFWLFVSVIVTLFVWMKIVDTPLECEALYTNLQQASYSSIEPVKDVSVNMLDWSKQSVKEIAESIGKTPINEPWMIGVLQNTLIDQVLDDQELVRDSFCEMIATILEERVDKSVWSFSVYLILFLIVSPIMTLVFRVVSFLSWIVLHVLKLLWVFKWKKRMRWIKELV